VTTYRFCPQCAKPLEDRQGGNGQGNPACPDGHFVHYDNPVPTANALIEQDGTYLILRRADEPKKGEWNLPGGFMESGESAPDTIIREVKEEANLEVEPVEFLGSFPSVYGDKSISSTFFICRLAGGNLSLSPESSEAAWVTLTDMPELAMADDQAAIAELRKRR